MAKRKELKFGDAFKYPFNKALRMFYILWVLLPIVGWFALGGYGVRRINEFIDGKFKNLPEMNFWSDFKLGLVMFLKAIPFMMVFFIIVSVLGLAPYFGVMVNWFLALFVLPILLMNFIKKQTVGSFFELEKTKLVFNNFADYVLTLLKCFALGIIFLVLMAVLVGIPAGQFTKNIFLADFYGRHVKK
jgi:hypothetical protein